MPSEDAIVELFYVGDLPWRDRPRSLPFYRDVAGIMNRRQQRRVHSMQLRQ
jgi:hypothetical protein